MHTCQRDVVDGCDRNRIRDLVCRKSEELPRARGGRYRKLKSMVESFGHHGYSGSKSALNLVGHCERQHEFLAGCTRLFGCCKYGSEVVAWMAKAAIGHIAIEKVDVAHERGIEKRRLIRGCLTAADQRAAARSPILLKLLTQGLEGLALQASDCAAETIQDVALVKLTDFGCEVLRPGSVTNEAMRSTAVSTATAGGDDKSCGMILSPQWKIFDYRDRIECLRRLLLTLHELT